MDELNNLRAGSRQSFLNANDNEQYSRGNNLRFVVCHQQWSGLSSICNQIQQGPQDFG